MQIPANKPFRMENKEDIPKVYRDIASGMERQFIEYMLEKMKATVGEEETSTSQNYYNSLQTSEQAKEMVNLNGGLGIQEMIINQIYPKKPRNVLPYNKENRQ